MSSTDTSNQTQIITLVLDSKEAEKKFEEIEKITNKLNEIKINLDAGSEENFDEKIASIDKSITDLKTIDVEVDDDKLNKAEEEIVTLKERLSAEEILLKAAIASNDEELTAQVQEQIDKINSRVSYLDIESGVYDFSAFIDENKISSYLNNFETYAYGLFDSIVEHINTNKLNNLTNDYVSLK